jgi:hypothetical protein
VFWALAAVTRADVAEPGASRYIYIGAVFIMLIAAEAGSGLELRGWGLAVAAVLLAGAVIANVGALRTGERTLRKIDDSVRASLATLDVAAPAVSRAFAPEPVDAPQITAGRYLAASRALGSPALSLSELQRAPESIRQAADSTLERAETLAPAPGSRSSSCAAIPAGAALVVPAGRRMLIESGPPSTATVYLRRFASNFPTTPFAAVRSAAATLAFPADLAPMAPWHVRFGGAGIAHVCLA